MALPSTQIPLSSIILDESIYPRKAVDHRRVAIFAENIRDGIAFDPIEVEPFPDKPGFYRHLDGVHRWNAYKATGAEMAVLPNPPKADLQKGFTVAQVAEKHGWQEPLVWSLALEGKTDHDRFKALGWGFRTCDLWEFNDCDNRFGDDWSGRIPAQLIAHILRYFSQPGDLVLDPMAGGGVTPDTCLAMNRRCWAFDMEDRPDTRPESEGPSKEERRKETAKLVSEFWEVFNPRRIFFSENLDKQVVSYIHTVTDKEIEFMLKVEQNQAGPTIEDWTRINEQVRSQWNTVLRSIRQQFRAILGVEEASEIEQTGAANFGSACAPPE